ncbi:hypothetical protein [Enterococcus cecorum]|uniref:hypothetical protein n=1 Tax=Enterococcus cecorum TaxID=44008 RepID=UPI00148B3EE2|nr:hypothetical protein [Enterococcus cecorum]
MRPLIMSGLNPLNKVGWTILNVENDTIGLATTEDNLTFDTVVEIKLSKENICQLRDYLTDFLNEEHAKRYYLISENGKYLNIDSTEYIGFGEKESKYKNTFTDRDIYDYDLLRWIAYGKVKKILVEDTNNETE